MPSNLKHYLRYRLGLEKASTQMTAAERDLLRKLAPGRGIIVELGTFEGMSSLLLREAMDADAELYCVDPFPLGRLPFSVQLSIAKREIGRSANGTAYILRQHSHDAVSEWTHRVDLLVMDGDHSFEGALRDLRDWARFMQAGGLVAVHTSRNSPAKPVPDHCGPLRLVNEVITGDPGFKAACYADSLSVFEKL